MKVLFDSQIFRYQRVGGISKYFSELISSFALNPQLLVEPIIFKKSINNFHLKKTLLENNLINEGDISRYGKLINLSNTHDLKPKFDLVHFTYYLPSWRLFSKETLKVSTIHDFIPEKQFKFFDPKRYTHYLKNQYLRKSHGLIFISHSTLEDFYSIPPKIKLKNYSIIHHGITNNIDSKDNFTKYGNFFLYVGDRGHYKNFSILQLAFAEFIKESNFNLICFGGGGVNRQEKRFIYQSGLKDRIFFLNDQDVSLETLYWNAAALINTSLDEGYGLTNIEAISHGCKVICSDIKIYREVLNDLVAYFDPYSPDSLLEKMRILMHDRKAVRNTKILSKFSTWYQVAQKTANFYFIVDRT